MKFISGLLVSSSILVASAFSNANSIPKLGPAAEVLRSELLAGEWVKNIRDSKPEFSWVVPAAKEGARQVGYQIQLRPLGQDFDGEDKALWDSGKVKSSRSVAVPYQGAALAANSDYHWRVKLWLKSKKSIETHWSSAQRISTAKNFDKMASRHPIISSRVEPKFIKQLPSGRYLIDFGKVAFGVLGLSLKASEAGTLTIHFGERGSEAGVKSDLAERSSVRYYQVPLDVHEKWGIYRVEPPRDVRNTKPNKAIPIPSEYGRIAPFRYIEIEAKDIDISDIAATQIAVHTPFDPYASSFKSSSKILNDIWDLCKYSMKATSFAGVYVDGDRERIPYEADAYINQLSHYLVDSEYSLARYSHEYLMEHPTWPTEWTQHSIMMAYVDWMYTGDTESMRLYYDDLKNKKLFLPLARGDGLLESFPNQKTRAPTQRDIVDWPPSERDSYDFRKVNTVVNAFHYLNLKQMSEMAQALGHDGDAKEFSAKAKRFKGVLNNKLFNQNTGLYIDGEGSSHSSFHANVAPLAFGLVPEARQSKVVEFIKSKGMAGSVYFAQYLMDALYSVGEEDYALEMLTSKAKRSWYNMLRVGSTITLEAWDDEFKPNQDWNHAWGAVPGNIVGRYLLGVRPLEAGFKRFTVEPQLGQLTFAEGVVPSIRGGIPIRLERRGSGLDITFTVPGNSQAELRLPAKSEAIKVNGKQRKAELVGGRKLILLGPGHYDVQTR